MDTKDMDPRQLAEVVKKMSDKERQIVTVLYLKDITDLLQSFMDHHKIPKNHY